MFPYPHPKIKDWVHSALGNAFDSYIPIFRELYSQTYHLVNATSVYLVQCIILVRYGCYKFSVIIVMYSALYYLWKLIEKFYQLIS